MKFNDTVYLFNDGNGTLSLPEIHIHIILLGICIQNNLLVDRQELPKNHNFITDMLKTPEKYKYSWVHNLS